MEFCCVRGNKINRHHRNALLKSQRLCSKKVRATKNTLEKKNGGKNQHLSNSKKCTQKGTIYTK